MYIKKEINKIICIYIIYIYMFALWLITISINIINIILFIETVYMHPTTKRLNASDKNKSCTSGTIVYCVDTALYYTQIFLWCGHSQTASMFL